jgi:hypothetical protein
LDTVELDNALNELETRVERLRSLYEQYFLGIERIEPAVARKDVDRRIWLLRREKIRNTAKRFRLQTIIQRYNTFQQYWQRICREIDRGTYRRHVLRAERATTTVSDIVSRREQGERPSESALEAARTSSDDLADMLARDVDAEQEFARALAEVGDDDLPPEAPGLSPALRRRLDTLDLELEGLDPGRHAGAPAALEPESPRKRGNLLAALGRRGGTEAESTAGGAGPALRRQRAAEPDRRAALRSAAAADPTGAAPEPPAKPALQPLPAASPGLPKDAASPQAPAKKAASSQKEGLAGLTDQRIAELHQQLLAAKQRTKEGGNVSVAGLAKSLRAAESKLKQQHNNRRVDFDVVIKNGKAVVKPIVR